MTIEITRKTEKGNTYVVLTAPATGITWFSGVGYMTEEMVPSQAERFAKQILAMVDDIKKADNANRMYRGSRFYP